MKKNRIKNRINMIEKIFIGYSPKRNLEI